MSNTHPSELASNATEHKVASDHHYHMFRRTGSRAHAEAADAHEFAMHDRKHPQINTNQHIKAQADLSSKNARLKSVKANSGTNPKTFRKPMNESTIQIIEAIDAGKDFKASEIIEAALWEKVGNMIVEKKKKIVAKSFGSMKTNKETSDSLTKKSQRKALKTKLVGKLEKEPMHKLKFGGMSEENEAEHYKSLRDIAKSFNYAFSHAKEGKDVYKHSKPASLSIQHDGQGWGHGVHQNRVNGKNSTDLHKHLSSIHGMSEENEGPESINHNFTAKHTPGHYVVKHDNNFNNFKPLHGPFSSRSEARTERHEYHRHDPVTTGRWDGKKLNLGPE